VYHLLGEQVAALALVPSHVPNRQILGGVECILTTSNLLGKAVRVTMVLATSQQPPSLTFLVEDGSLARWSELAQLVSSHPRDFVVLNIEDQQLPLIRCVTSCRDI
jgi:hypothetical protein